MAMNDVQYITDANGQHVGVIVPIDLWREIASQGETSYGVKKESVKTGPLEGGGGVSAMTLLEAGIEICGETGLPVFRVSPDAPQITTAFVKQLEEEW